MVELSFRIMSVRPNHHDPADPKTDYVYSLACSAFGARFQLAVTSKDEVSEDLKDLLGEPTIDSVGNIITFDTEQRHIQTRVQTEKEPRGATAHAD